jgi:hypothetical protein
MSSEGNQGDVFIFNLLGWVCNWADPKIVSKSCYGSVVGIRLNIVYQHGMLTDV